MLSLYQPPKFPVHPFCRKFLIAKATIICCFSEHHVIHNVCALAQKIYSEKNGSSLLDLALLGRYTEKYSKLMRGLIRVLVVRFCYLPRALC